MKVRRVTVSFSFCFTILVIMFVFIDIRIKPQHANTHLHLYYSYVNNGSSPNHPTDVVGRNIKFINIFNQTTASHLRTNSRHLNDASTDARPQATTSAETSGSGSSAHIIAIVSYMRSGSTLTADIMQHFPKAMFVFEPFHALVIRARNNLPVYYLDGTVKRLTSENITDDLLRSELRKWFECRLGDLDVHSLTDSFHVQYSRSLRDFFNCWKSKPRTRKTLRECLPDAIEKCKRAKYRLFKFIRLPMRVVKSVEEFYPGLQVIHLIRDPRGSLSSQIKVKKITWNRIGNLSQQFCTRVADDINSTLSLIHQSPKRAKVLLYEKLAENPLTMASKLYNFTHMPRYPYVMRYIKKLTMSGLKHYRLFGSFRGNSTKAAYQWRDTINFEHLQTIDGNCANIYDFIGYQKFESIEDVRNHELLTLTSPESSVFL